MFYQTTVKSLVEGGVIDAKGKKLSFIGNKLLKVGDVVWTDGNVIFGHTPIRGGGLLYTEQSGVPVLGDEDLRGYFDKSGNFKEYEVVQDDWIVNDNKKFAHGQEEFNGEKVIDAEIAEDGSTFIVTDGFYRKCQTVTYNNHLFYMNNRYRDEVDESTGEVVTKSEHSIIVGVEPFVGQEVTLGVDVDDVDKKVMIFKGDQKVTEISLSEYAQKAIEECQRCEKELKEQPNEVFPYWDCPNETEPVNFIQQPEPPDSFIALSYARIELFRVDKNGNWDAIISASAYGYCFLNINLPGSVFETQFYSYSGLREFSKSLILCLDNLESAVFDEKLYPFLSLDKYPDFKGRKTDDNGNYTAEYKSYIKAKLEYYIPLVRFKHYRWEPFCYSSFFLFRVHNGEITDTMAATSGGGGTFPCTEAWDEENNYMRYFFQIRTPERPFSDDYGRSFIEDIPYVSFPIDEDFELEFNGLELIEFHFCGHALIYFRDENIFSDIFAMPDYPLGYWFLYDEVALQLVGLTQDTADPSNENLAKIHHRWIPVFVSNAYDIEEYLKVEDKGMYYFVGCHLSADTDDGFFSLKPLAMKLKDDYFFGIRGGKLYKIDDTLETVGDGLKNFRLRELKKISKAKK